MRQIRGFSLPSQGTAVGGRYVLEGVKSDSVAYCIVESLLVDLKTHNLICYLCKHGGGGASERKCNLADT